MRDTQDYSGLHSFWLRQLMMEFEDICYSYGVDLRPPVFEIIQSEKKLGGWNPGTRSIAISQSLIVNHNWSTTLHVLKHEMAHQYCSEKLHKVGRPHGEDFQLACDILGVPLEYRNARADLRRVLESLNVSSRQLDRGRKVLDKVEKLLALSKSANEHEAALAMEKAHELAQKYHLQPELDENNTNFNFVVIDKKKKRLTSYQKTICMILSDFFLVKVVISERYDPQVNDTFKIIELLGARENLTIAEYCYYFLENQLQILWKANRSKFSGGSTIRQKNSYYLGVLHGFHSHLGLGKKKNPTKDVGAGSRELVEVKEEMLNNYVAMRFPRLRKPSKQKVKVNTGAYEKGVESGKEMSFTEGIDRGSKNFGGLLN